MILSFSQNFQRRLAKLVENNIALRKKFKKQIALFQENPSHIGLRLHKLKGKRSEQYAIWIDGDLRAVAVKDGDSYLFFDLVNHDQY